MPTGDFPFVCPFCGRMEYYATGCSCVGWTNQMAKLPKSLFWEEPKFGVYSYCSECGQPTPHMSFFEAPICDKCRSRPEYEI